MFRQVFSTGLNILFKIYAHLAVLLLKIFSMFTFYSKRLQTKLLYNDIIYILYFIQLKYSFKNMKESVDSNILKHEIPLGSKLPCCISNMFQSRKCVYYIVIPICVQYVYKNRKSCCHRTKSPSVFHFNFIFFKSIN